MSFPKAFPKITVAIAILIVAAHLMLSSNALFPRSENISEFGFSLGRPENILLYNFVHVDYSHVAFNVAALLAGGLVAEAMLRKRDFLALFFAGSAFAAFAFVLISPEYAVVGSSAGATSVLAAAFTLDSRASVKATLVFMFLAFAAVSAGNFYVESATKKLGTEIIQLEEVKQVAIQQQDFNLAERTLCSISAKQIQVDEIKHGTELKKSIPPSFGIHAFAALFGAAYAYFFARKSVQVNAQALFSPLARFFRRGYKRNR